MNTFYTQSTDGSYRVAHPTTPNSFILKHLWLPSIVRTFRSRYIRHVGKKQKLKVAMKPNSTKIRPWD